MQSMHCIFYWNQSYSLLKKQTQDDGKNKFKKKAYQFNLRRISFLKIFLVGP